MVRAHQIYKVAVSVANNLRHLIIIVIMIAIIIITMIIITIIIVTTVIIIIKKCSPVTRCSGCECGKHPATLSPPEQFIIYIFFILQGVFFTGTPLKSSSMENLG